jgi:hypothetical protein
MNMPQPSDALRIALNQADTIVYQNGWQSAAWSAMAQSLFLLYTALKARGKLELAFCRDNPFDRSMLVWCIEADQRKTKTRMETPEILKELEFVLPSIELISSLAGYQSVLRQQGMRKAPEEIVMAAAFMLMYRAHKNAGDLDVKFDPKNEFDQSMLAWCMEADRRQRAKLPDFSRN